MLPAVNGYPISRAYSRSGAGRSNAEANGPSPELWLGRRGDAQVTSEARRVSGRQSMGEYQGSGAERPGQSAEAETPRLPVMQQPLRRQLGATGEAAVDLFFKDLGWGPLSTGDQDLGTDLFVQIRDAALSDLTLMIGVQIKTGNSWFGTPGELSGQHGWWYAESDQRHANYWTNHPVPHMIVLQNEDRSVRVWNFINRETIQNTGRGFKVFVPSDQVLAASQADYWVNAAIKALKQLSLEGSRWDFAIGDVADVERARYALLAPRLVEPHPNKGFAAPISWPEAIALCVQADADRWEHFAQSHETVPSLSEAHASDEWGWRFAAAIHSWIYAAAVEPLELLSTAGINSQNRTARDVALSLALVDQGRREDAQAVLARNAIENEYSAEQGWLSLHRARIFIEAGQLDEGRRLLEQATVQLAPVPRDVTVSALRAAAAWGLFEITDFGLQDVSAVVPAMDTVASWWRTQTVASALESAVTRSFQSWAGDTSINLGPDTPHNLLFSAALVARLAGSHGQWRANMALLAAVDLSTERPHKADFDEPLDELRRAGDDKNLALAIQRIRRIGPLRALQTLIKEVNSETVTRTTSRSDLVTIRYAGALAAAEDAERLLDFLLDSLESPEDYIARYSPSYDVLTALAEALTGIISFADDVQQGRLIDIILQLPDTPNQLLALSLHRLSTGLSKQAIEESQAAILHRAASSDMAPWFRWCLLAMIGPDDAGVRETIRQGLLAGSLDSLDALGTIDRLNEDEARQILNACRIAIEGYRQEGLTGGLSIGGPDLAMLFAKIAVYLPGIADWEHLIEFLADTNVVAERKRDTCKFLSAVSPKLEAKVRTELQRVTGVLRTAPKKPLDVFAGLEPIGGAFDELFLSLAGEDHPSHDEILTVMLTGDESDRYDAADYLSSKAGSERVLAVLTADDNYRVSRRAMLCLARRLAETAAPKPSHVAVLIRLLDHDGEANALHIAGGLASAANLPQQLQPVLAKLCCHPSITVRAKAAVLVERSIE